MSDPNRPIAEEELHAYVDNQLDPDRHPAVLRYLQEHPDVARQVAGWRAQRDALRTAFAAVATQPIPPRLELERLIEQRLGQRRTPWRVAAAVVLSVGIGGVGSWLLLSGPNHDRSALAMSVLQDEAISSHRVYGTDRRHPIEVAASERDHLTQWLSNRLNRTVVPPDLSSFGYTLIGGRLLATEQGNAAALFMYENHQGNRMSLLMRPMAPEFHVPIVDWDRGQINACAWIDKGMGYALLGAVPDDQLDRIARQISGQQM
jgi:anti-sigma factor RsiW